jgi:hypothetical protein
VFAARHGIPLFAARRFTAALCDNLRWLSVCACARFHEDTAGGMLMLMSLRFSKNEGSLV